MADDKEFQICEMLFAVNSKLNQGIWPIAISGSNLETLWSLCYQDRSVLDVVSVFVSCIFGSDDIADLGRDFDGIGGLWTYSKMVYKKEESVLLATPLVPEEWGFLRDSKLSRPVPQQLRTKYWKMWL